MARCFSPKRFMLWIFVVAVGTLTSCNTETSLQVAKSSSSAQLTSTTGVLTLQDFWLDDNNELVLGKNFEAVAFAAGRERTVSYTPEDKASQEAASRSIIISSIDEQGLLINYETKLVVPNDCYQYLLDGRSSLLYIATQPGAIDDFFDNSSLRLVAEAAGEICITESGSIGALSTYSRLNISHESFRNIINYFEDSGIEVDLSSEKPELKLGISSWFSKRTDVPRSDVNIKFETPAVRDVPTKPLGEINSKFDSRYEPGKVADPPVASLKYDEKMGMYWNPTISRHWDPNLKMYYDAKVGIHWDPVQKMHYDTRLNMHYDASSSMHFDAKAGLHWDPAVRMHWNKATRTYIDTKLDMTWDPVKQLHWDPKRALYWDAKVSKHWDPNAYNPVNGKTGMHWDKDSGMYWDPAVKMPYDARIDLHWDPATKMHWSARKGQHWDATAGLWWNSKSKKYQHPVTMEYSNMPKVEGRMVNNKFFPFSKKPDLPPRPRTTGALAQNVTQRPTIPARPQYLGNAPYLGARRPVSYGISNKNDLLILNQGDSGTCLPTSAAMALDTIGVKFKPEVFRDLISVKGADFSGNYDYHFLDQMNNRLNGADGATRMLPENFKSDFHMSQGELPNPLEHAALLERHTTDAPVIASINIRFQDGSSGGHAIVIDNVTKFDDVYIITGRNPWGDSFAATSDDLASAFRRGGAEFGDKKIVGVDFRNDFISFTKTK